MNEIQKLIQECRDLKKEVGIKNKELTELKKTIRLYMIDSGVPEVDGVTTRRSFSFDIGKFKKEYPETLKKFTKTETITTTNEIVDTKGIKVYYPEEYKKCIKEGTVKLYGL